MNQIMVKAGKVMVRAGRVILNSAACIERCCGDGGGGGDPHWIILRKYCIDNDGCDAWTKVWSETPWGDGTTWGRSFRAPPGYGCPLVYKLAGVCYVGYCSGTGGHLDCTIENIPVYDGPGTGIQWFHWSERQAACGPCCLDIHCYARHWLTCYPTQHYACQNLGREFNVTRRLTSSRKVEITPGYLAFVNSQTPPENQCYDTLEQSQRCNRVTDNDWYLRLLPNGCYESTIRCNRDHADFQQSALLRYPDCVRVNTGDSVELCGTSSEISAGGPNVSAQSSLGSIDVCGYSLETDNTNFWIGSDGCMIKSGSYSHTTRAGSPDYFQITWNFYEDGNVSRLQFSYQHHSFCQTIRPAIVECFVTHVEYELLYQFRSLTPCQADDETECGLPGFIPDLSVKLRKSRTPTTVRQTAEDGFGGRIPGTNWSDF